MSSEAVIETQGLTKRYGRTWALRGLDIEVGQGQIYGLLGPNGAGKTTAIRVLTGLVRANIINFASYSRQTPSAPVLFHPSGRVCNSLFSPCRRYGGGFQPAASDCVRRPRAYWHSRTPAASTVDSGPVF